jgi:hypothetical protein
MKDSRYMADGGGRWIALVLAGVALFFGWTSGTMSSAQVEPPPPAGTQAPALRVFLDCPECDLAGFQAEIAFADFVSGRDEAQVEVAIAKTTTEAGVEYVISFRGRNEFAGDDDVIPYQPASEATPEEAQAGLVKTVKMGLMRYAGKTPLSGRLSIRLLDAVKPTAVEDKWNFWVFSLSANSFLNGEQSYKDGMYYGSFSANRVTPEIKIRLAVNVMFQKDKYIYEDEEYESHSDSQSFRGLVVKSLNDHWSVGGFLNASASTYSNIKFSLIPAPAVEYDFFPYSESTKKQLRFLYRLNFIAVSYLEETIYQKTSEKLWQNALSLTLELVQKWGTISASLEGSHYFHDFSKYRLQLWSEMSLRLFQGLNFNIYGSYSRIHDQLSLPAGGASLEEILLRRKQLATDYDYYFSIGLSYTFGSTKSKVVNPRFGDGGGGVSISISM